MIARLAALQRQTIEAALLAWPLWIACAELRASEARTAHGLLLVAGSSALWLLLGSNISEDVLRTPLVLRARGVPTGLLTTRVRAVDLHPTLLEMTAGIGAGGVGRHLAPVWQRRESADRDVYARTSYKGWSLRAALIGRYKLVHDLGTGQRSLYDLHGAGERVDVLDREPAIAADLTLRMGRVWDVAINDVVLARKLRARAAR